MTLVRKIRKDIGERRSEALDEVKRLLPLQKPSFDIYVVEPFDGVNNRMTNSEMKKHGLQVARKVKFYLKINLFFMIIRMHSIQFHFINKVWKKKNLNLLD